MRLKLRRLLKRIKYTRIFWFGNLRKCNRDYWGWISMATAWEAAKCLETIGE